MKITKRFKSLLVLMVLAVFLVSGATGCPQQGGGGGTSVGVSDVKQPSTSAANYGIDFAFVDAGIDYLKQGKEITAGDDFNVEVHLENYIEDTKSVKVCIRDDLSGWGGIPEGECQTVILPRAIYKNEKAEVGSENVIFGPFKFDQDYPLSKASIEVIAKIVYEDMYLAEYDVKVSGDERESSGTVAHIKESPSHLGIRLQKNLGVYEGQYRLELDFTVSKRGDVKITDLNSGKEGFTFLPQLFGSSIKCDYDDPATKFMKFEERSSTSLINCEALLPKEDLSYPLKVNIQYKSESEKRFKFQLKGKKQSLV